MQNQSLAQLGSSKNTSIINKATECLAKHHWMEPWYMSYAILGCTMGLSVFLYSQAGTLAQRFGPIRVLQNFLRMRLMAFLGFYLLGVFHFGRSSQLILFGFSVVVLCWPFLIVSATALSALLSPLGEGEGMGIFCAVLALACVTGSAFGGWLASQWGYNAVSGAVVVTEALATILMHRVN